MKEKNTPIPLASPDGRVFAFACPHCLEVRASMSGGGFGDEGRESRMEHSRNDAERCCRCRTCGTLLGNRRICCGDCERAQRAEQDAYLESDEFKAYQESQRLAAATFDASPNPSAARLLARYMSELSEQYYCAGWMMGLEHTLWRVLQGGDRDYGLGSITDEEVAQLRYLSEQAGGWVRYDISDVDHSAFTGEVFMPLQEWLRRVEAAAKL